MFIESETPKQDKKHPITQSEAEIFINNNLAVLKQWADDLPIVEEFVEVGQAQNYPVCVPKYAAERVQYMMDEGILPYSLKCSNRSIRGTVRGVVEDVVIRKNRGFSYNMIIQDITLFVGVRCTEFDANWEVFHILADILRSAE